MTGTAKTTYREAIREAMREAMQRDPRVFLMGEDVGDYGGCFAVSKGLLAEFGPERIRVNCMVPGWVMTERQVRLWLNPEGERQIAERQCLPDRLQPSDIARMALFLAADDSRMCSSQQFIVDGGWV